MARASRSHIRMSCQEVDPFRLRICRQESEVCTVLNIQPIKQVHPGGSARWARVGQYCERSNDLEIDADVQNGTEDSFPSDRK
jgi:hypothetical protein